MPPKSSSKKSPSAPTSSSSSSSSSSKGREREGLEIKTLVLDADGKVASTQFFDALKTPATKTILKLRSLLHQGCRRPGKESPFVFREFLTPKELAGATLFYVPAVHDFVLARLATDDVYYNPSNAGATHLAWYYADDSAPTASASSSSSSSSSGSSADTELLVPFDVERTVVAETLCNTSPEQKSFLLGRLFSEGILQRAFPLAHAVVADSAPLSVTNFETLDQLRVPYASALKTRAAPNTPSVAALLNVARRAIEVGSGSDPGARARLLNYWESVQGFRLVMPVQQPARPTRAIPLKDAESLRATFIRHLFHPAPAPAPLPAPAVSSPRRPVTPSRPPSPPRQLSPPRTPPTRPPSLPRKSPGQSPRSPSPPSPPSPLPSHPPPPLPVSLPPTEPAGPALLPVSPPRAHDRPLATSTAPFLVRMLLQDIMTRLERGLGDAAYTVARLTQSRRVVSLQLPTRGGRSPRRSEGKGERKLSGGGGGANGETKREDAEVIRLYLNDREGRTRLRTYTEWVFSDRFPNAPVMRGVVTEGDEAGAIWRATDFPLQTGGRTVARSVTTFTQYVASTAIAVADGDVDPPTYDDTPAVVPILGPRPHPQTAADAKREGEQQHYVRVLEILPQALGGSAPYRGFVQWIDDAPDTERLLRDAIDFRAAGIHTHMIDQYFAWAQTQREHGFKPKTGRGFQRPPFTLKQLAAERKIINDTGTLIDCCTTTANNTQPLVPDDALHPLFGGTSVLMDEDTDAPYFLHERCLQANDLSSILNGDDADSEYHRQFALARIAQRLARRPCATT